MSYRFIKRSYLKIDQGVTPDIYLGHTHTYTCCYVHMYLDAYEYTLYTYITTERKRERETPGEGPL